VSVVAASTGKVFGDVMALMAGPAVYGLPAMRHVVVLAHMTVLLQPYVSTGRTTEAGHTSVPSVAPGIAQLLAQKQLGAVQRSLRSGMLRPMISTISRFDKAFVSPRPRMHPAYFFRALKDGHRHQG
jgi:hypothetical protein